jgi:hypothetical protein
MDNVSQKIFGIGFHRTGTTSLAAALRILGYRVTGPNGVNNPDIAETVHTLADSLVSQYDAFQDNPWPIIYPELDRKHPGSKFVLTIRSAESWINGQVKYFGRHDTPMRVWIYGVGHPEGNEDIYVKRYNDHNAAVLEYFKDRPQDLLVLDLPRGHGWNELCPFLDKPLPTVPFPHAKKTTRFRVVRKVFRRLLRTDNPGGSF